MSKLTGKRFVVWANYGSEGWQPSECDTFAEGVALREQQMGMGSSEVVLTEYVPLIYQDGRA